MTANAKLETPSKSEHSNARYEFLKINKELYFPMQIALNSRKVQNGILKICQVLLTNDQNDMRFSFWGFLMEKEHFFTKNKF